VTSNTGDGAERAERTRSAERRDWRTWPVYQASELGLRNFWYPVVWSSEVRARPVGIQLLGERVVLCRDGGRVYALEDRCPHRGTPLSLGRQHFSGTITCPYHGWTYRLDSGVMCAAITDGPESPITGKVAVRTYPAAERLGLVWVFVGAGETDVPPVEQDIPEELLGPGVTLGGRIQSGRRGNWRYAAENGFDEGHAKFLHRDALWVLFRQMPVWSETRIVRTDDGRWLSRRQERVYWDVDFPGVGRWPPPRSWRRLVQRRPRPNTPPKVHPRIAALRLPGMVSVRVPYILRVVYSNYIHYEWAIPEDARHHRYVQLMASFRPGRLGPLWFRLQYLAWIRWVFHGQFTGQDAWMVDVMDIPPERLYRPDASVIEWRRLVEEQHREPARDRDEGTHSTHEDPS
jgi:phenylpropionate dioxygenase-like ring-hydroxylating dioxygenase large terminal subunit